MAARKKSSTKKKSTKKKTTPPKTIKISGLSFKQEACSTSRDRADKAADKLRKDGYKARVIEKDGISCVFKGGRRKKIKKRKKRA